MGDISAPTIGSRPLQLAIVALAASASQQCAMSATSGQHVRRQHLVRLRKYLHGARLGAETILEMAGWGIAARDVDGWITTNILCRRHRPMSQARPGCSEPGWTAVGQVGPE